MFGKYVDVTHVVAMKIEMKTQDENLIIAGKFSMIILKFNSVTTTTTKLQGRKKTTRKIFISGCIFVVWFLWVATFTISRSHLPFFSFCILCEF